DRIEIFAVDVLDQRIAQQLLVTRVAQDDGHNGQARGLRGPETALPRDDLIAPIRGAASHERLEDPHLADRRCEPGERLVIEMRAWLLRVWRDRVDRYLEEPAGRINALGGAGDQRRQPPAQTASLRHHSPPLRSRRHRRRWPSSSWSVAPMDSVRSGAEPPGFGGGVPPPSSAFSSITTTRRSVAEPSGGWGTGRTLLAASGVSQISSSASGCCGADVGAVWTTREDGAAVGGGSVLRSASIGGADDSLAGAGDVIAGEGTEPIGSNAAAGVVPSGAAAGVVPSGPDAGVTSSGASAEPRSSSAMVAGSSSGTS